MSDKTRRRLDRLEQTKATNLGVWRAPTLRVFEQIMKGETLVPERVRCIFPPTLTESEWTELVEEDHEGA